MMFLHLNRLSCFLLLVLGAYQTKADNVDWENKYMLEQSWENQNLLKLKGDLEIEDGSDNQLVALREQPVRKPRVKRETPINSASGSADNNTITPLVICDKNSMTIVFEKDQVVSFDIDNMYLADGVCKASYNQTHVYVTTALNGCGTTNYETEQEMYYNNTLTAHLLVAPGTVITRKRSIGFTFKCSYSSLISVSGFSFTPPKPFIEVEESDIGEFTVNLDSFSDDGFLSPTSEQYPAFKSFEDRIHIQYGLNSSNADIVVRAETCRATPSSKPDDTPQYEFISEACDKDSTIIHHTTGLRQTHRFSIQVFRFVANHTFVYVHCDLRLCNKNTQDSVCTRSTTCSNRKRRDVSPLDRNYQLSIGPIIYREKINDEVDEGPDKVTESSPNTIMIVILVGVGLIVFLLAVTVVFLVRKRRVGNQTASLEVIPMQYPADKMMAFGNGHMGKN